jgi:alcohol dehydrogenase
LISDLMSDSVRATGLSALMKGAGLVTRFIPIPQPTLLVGPGSSARLGQAIAGFGHSKILIVTDSIISKLGLLKGLTDALTEGGARFVVFDEITPDAPIPLIEKAIDFYKEHDCDAIVAFGGGSSMDASKAIAVSVANPGKSLRQLAGYLKGLRSPVKIYAVPTTAGTGSEVTVAAVISDPETHRKLVIVDPRMVPKMAALDPALMTGLPPAITAATGIDALTHAIEAFVGNWKTPYSDDMALSAVGPDLRQPARGVQRRQEPRGAGEDGAGRHLCRLCLHPRQRRLRACHRAPVRRPVPHAARPGQRHHAALVLKYSLPAITDPAGRAGGAGQTGQGRGTGRRTGREVPRGGRTAQSRPRHSDLPAGAEGSPTFRELAKAACREAHTGYPVPRYMTQAVCEGIIRQVLPPQAAPAKAAPRKPTPRKRRPPRAMPGRRLPPMQEVRFLAVSGSPRPMQNRRSAIQQTRGAMQ